MNIQDIENKFLLLDKRTKRLSEYFNPTQKYKMQHPFITDLQDEYKEDSKTYSLNKYYYSSISPKSNPKSLPKAIKHVPSKTNPIQPTQNLPKASSKDFQSPRPRRKELTIDSMREVKQSEAYEGAFSSTKLLPDRRLKKSFEAIPPKRIEPWAEVSKSASKTFSNSASIIRFPIEPDSRVNKSYPDDISIEYIKNSYNDVSRISSNHFRDSVSPSEINKQSKSLSLDIQNKQILYQNDPNIMIKSKLGAVSVIISDTSCFDTKVYNELHVDRKFIQLKTGKKIDLSSEFSEVNNKLFKIQVKNCEEIQEFYVFIGKYSAEVEKNNLACIKKYNDLAYFKKDSSVKLPMIIETNNPTNLPKIQKSQNPLTGALYKFQKMNQLFIPELYLAKLSVFENHDFIRKKYSKKQSKYSYEHSH